MTGTCCFKGIVPCYNMCQLFHMTIQIRILSVKHVRTAYALCDIIRST